MRAVMQQAAATAAAATSVPSKPEVGESAEAGGRGGDGKQLDRIWKWTGLVTAARMGVSEPIIACKFDVFMRMFGGVLTAIYNALSQLLRFFFIRFWFCFAIFTISDKLLKMEDLPLEYDVFYTFRTSFEFCKGFRMEINNYIGYYSNCY